MGRASLMFVILMTTIFASVLVRVQRSIGGVPDVLIRNQLNKEIENISDFVLRAAVRNANSKDFLDSVLSGTEIIGELTHIQNFAIGERRIGNCDVLSLEYSYAHTADHYKVKTHIRGFMQGVEVFRDAEMAFSFPMVTLGKVAPNVVYLEFERLLLFPWLFDIFNLNNRFLPDSSPNNYGGQFHGFSFISPTAPYYVKDNIDDDVESWGGAYSKRYIKFNGYNNWVEVENKLPVGSEDDEALNTDTDFSLMCFAKIDKSGRNSTLGISDKRNQQGALVWIPSDLTDASMQFKPSAAIYFETTNTSSATGKMHFVVTRSDKDSLMVSIPYTRTAEVWQRKWLLIYYYIINPNHPRFPWNSYGLTYETKDEQSILTAYIDGRVVGQRIKEGAVRAHKSEYGMIMGRKGLNTSLYDLSHVHNRYFFGIMDQAGMDDRTFTPTEMLLWHQGVMKSTLVQYIRD